MKAERALFSTPNHGLGSAYLPAEEVEKLIAQAVQDYEAKQGAAETAALQNIRQEVEQQNARYQDLLGVNNELALENQILQGKLVEAEQAGTALALSHQTLLEQHRQQLEILKTLERQIEAKQSSEARAAPEERGANQQWREQVERECQQMFLEERAQMNSMLHTKEQEFERLRQRLDEQNCHLEEVQARLQERERELTEAVQMGNHEAERETAEIKNKMAALSEYMTSMEEILEEKEATIQQLEAQRRSYEKEKLKGIKQEQQNSKTIQENMEQQLHSLRTSLDQQTSDVRKKMHRVAVLEKEKKLLQAEVEEWRRIANAVGEQQATLHHSLVVLSRESAAQWKTFAAAQAKEEAKAEVMEGVATAHQSKWHFAFASSCDLQDESVPRTSTEEARRGKRNLEEKAVTLSPHVVLRRIASDNAATIRVAQLLGRRSRSLISLYIARIEELSQMLHTREESWLKEKGLLEDACRFLKEKRAAEQKQCKEGHDKTTHLLCSLEEMEESFSKQEEVCRSLQAEAEALRRTNQQTALQLQQSEAHLSHVREELSSCKESSAIFQREKEAATLESLQLRTELDRLRTNHNTQMEEGKHQLSTLRSKVKESEAQRESVAKELESLKSSYADIQSKLTTLKAQGTLRRQAQEKEKQQTDTQVTSLRDTVVSLKSLQRTMEETHKTALLKVQEEANSNRRHVRVLGAREKTYKEYLQLLCNDLDAVLSQEEFLLESVREALQSCTDATVQTEKNDVDSVLLVSGNLQTLASSSSEDQEEAERLAAERRKRISRVASLKPLQHHVSLLAHRVSVTFVRQQSELELLHRMEKNRNEKNEMGVKQRSSSSSRPRDCDKEKMDSALVEYRGEDHESTLPVATATFFPSALRALKDDFDATSFLEAEQLVGCVPSATKLTRAATPVTFPQAVTSSSPSPKRWQKLSVERRDDEDAEVRDSPTKALQGRPYMTHRPIRRPSPSTDRDHTVSRGSSRSPAHPGAQTGFSPHDVSFESFGRSPSQRGGDVVQLLSGTMDDSLPPPPNSAVSLKRLRQKNFLASRVAEDEEEYEGGGEVDGTRFATRPPALY